MKLTIYTDGGARNNPGPAGIGVVIYKSDFGKSEFEKLGEYKEFIGEATNNQAEYRAVILAMERARELGGTELSFYLDSQLIVEQLNGNYQVKHKDLQPLFIKVYNLSMNFKKVSYQHVTRDKNKEADKLVNQAIDQALGIKRLKSKNQNAK